MEGVHHSRRGIGHRKYPEQCRASGGSFARAVGGGLNWRVLPTSVWLSHPPSMPFPKGNVASLSAGASVNVSRLIGVAHDGHDVD